MLESHTRELSSALNNPFINSLLYANKEEIKKIDLNTTEEKRRDK